MRVHLSEHRTVSRALRYGQAGPEIVACEHLSKYIVCLQQEMAAGIAYGGR